MGDGLAKARETADKMKADQKAEEEKAATTMQNTKNQLAALSANEALAKMYADNAKVGAENLGGELPQLKVHSVGRSQNELADGSEPQDGFFFYKPTHEEFETIDVHILTISKGFRAPGLEGSDKKEVFNQLVGGYILVDGDYKPFVMYFTGLKLSHLWNFGKEAAKYTRAKPIPIPMYALTIRMSTERIKNSYGKSWIVKFEIVKTQDGSPKLVLDPGEFQFLLDSVSEMKEKFAQLIGAKQQKPETTIQEDEGNPEDIPFS